jgi:hypothetical protein
MALSRYPWHTQWTETSVDFVRTGLGGVAIMAGAWWWAEADVGRRSMPEIALILVGWLLLAAAVLAVVRLLRPVATLVTACLVALAGTTLVLLPDRWPMRVDASAQLRYLLIAAGFAALMWPRRRLIGPEQRKVWAVLWPVRYVMYRPGPATTIVAAVLGDVTLDFSRADRPVQTRIDLFIRVYGGRVTVVFPPDWKVCPGHVDSTHAVALSGQFTCAVSADDPPEKAGYSADDPPEEAGYDVVVELTGLRRVWRLVRSVLTGPGEVAEPEPAEVPIVQTSISGIGGSVAIVRA